MRLSPGRFKHRNSEVWWNCLRSAVSIIATSGERHSPPSCSADHSPYTSQLLPLRTFGRWTDPIRCSVQKITSADFILEIEPKRTSAGEISPPRSSGEPQDGNWSGTSQRLLLARGTTYNPAMARFLLVLACAALTLPSQAQD